MEGRPLDESELIARARSGDGAAFKELIVTFQGIAFRTAYLITGHAGDAEDAAQTAFIKAYYALGRFRPGSAFRPWLLAIVANEARNKRRSAGRRSGMELRLAGSRPRDDAAPSPEDVVLRSERDGALVAAMNQLKESDRLVLACRFLLGMNEAETAAALSCPRGTVKSRCSRALKRLRTLLDESAPEVSR